MLVIFPFEEAIYRDGGVPVEFVGHPLIDLAAPSAPRDAFLAAHRPGAVGADGRDPAGQPAERGVADPARPAAAAASCIRAAVPGAQFVVARAPHLDDGLFDAVGRAARRVAPVAVVEGETDAVLASADVALTASGTATVQTALHDTPMVDRLPGVAADVPAGCGGS